MSLKLSIMGLNGDIIRGEELYSSAFWVSSLLDFSRARGALPPNAMDYQVSPRAHAPQKLRNSQSKSRPRPSDPCATHWERRKSTR